MVLRRLRTFSDCKINRANALNNNSQQKATHSRNSFRILVGVEGSQFVQTQASSAHWINTVTFHLLLRKANHNLLEG